MKKITLLTVAAISAAAITGPAITADAGIYQVSQGSNKNITIITGNKSCDIQSLIQDIQNRYPSVNFPCLPGAGLPIFPDNDKPGTDMPDNDQPGQDTPGNDVPDSDIPDNDTPDNDTPDNDIPDNDTPDNDIPDNDIPDNDIPDNNIPDQDTPDNTPDQDNPGTDNDQPDTDLPDTDAPDNKPDNDRPGDSDKPDTEQPGEDNQLTFAEQVVRLVNQERAKHGLSALTVDENVRKAAMVRAKEIQTSFSHTRPNGTSFATALKEENVSYRGAGENIAWGQRTPEQVMEGWMNSEGHRANILNPKFTTIGVGYLQNSNGVNYWTQLFTY